MKNVSVKSGQKNKMPKILNFENKNLIVHLRQFLLLKAHRDLICKIHKSILPSAGRASYVTLKIGPRILFCVSLHSNALYLIWDYK